MAGANGVLELQEPSLGTQSGGQPLQCFTKISSEIGLSSVTTLIVGSKAAVVIDPPFLVPDAKAVVEFIKEKTDVPVVAVFTTHHHPDHYFSANPILDAFPGSKFYAHEYVRAGIDREYDEKVVYWPKLFGKENCPDNPQKPEVYPYSFFILPEDTASPIVLLGPVQGDSVDHTLFWLPQERTIITGDAVYARSTHAWVEEVETAEILHAWKLTLMLIESLNPERIIAGHIEEGWEFDARKDMAHMHKYLDLFEQKITKATKKPTKEELFETFKKAFPECEKNHDFFLGHMSNHFGEGGTPWAENRHHNVGSRTRDTLEGFLLGLGASK